MAKNVRQNAINAQRGTNILHYTDYISIFIQQGNIVTYHFRMIFLQKL